MYTISIIIGEIIKHLGNVIESDDTIQWNSNERLFNKFKLHSNENQNILLLNFKILLQN